jgi:hypothetical protein
MPIHYGPEWAWDYTRPEAIEALRQMKEGHKVFGEVQPHVSECQAEKLTLLNQAAIYFRQAAQLLLASSGKRLRSVRTVANRRSAD